MTQFVVRILLITFTLYTLSFTLAKPIHAWDSAWKYQLKLSFRNGSRTENLINFPILVHLTSKNFDFSQSKTNGEDIRFIDSDDSTVLSYEIESWNSGAKEAWIWVKVPQIDKTSDGDFITMYWGNSGASDRQDKVNVWDSNFIMVQHMQENSGTTTSDATSNGNNGTKVSATEPSPSSSGQIDGAQNFDGTDDYITVSDSNSLDLTTAFTLEGWVKLNALPQENATRLLAKENVGNLVTNAYGFGVLFSGKLRFTLFNTVDIDDTGSNTVTANKYYHIAVSHAGSQYTFYINGARNSTLTDVRNPTANGQTLLIGRRGNNSGQEYINGLIDEVRISSTARSAPWISAEYASMTDSFITYGNPPQEADLSSIPDGSYLNYGSFPITFIKSTETLYPVDKYQIIVDHDKDGQTIIVDNILPKGDRANHADKKYHQTNTWKASYDREDDTDTTNDRITISNIPDTTTNLQGNTTTIWPLKEGKRTITVRAIDERGNTRDETKTLYLDYHKPLVSGVRIAGILLPPRRSSANWRTTIRGESFTTVSTKPTFSGQIQDLPVGDNLGLSNKDKTLGNIKAVYVTIKDAGSGKSITTQEASLSANDCPNQLLFPDRPDLEKGCIKSFLFKPTTLLSYGTYKVTIEGKDKAGNLSLPTAILLTITSPESTPTPEGTQGQTFSPSRSDLSILSTPPITPPPAGGPTRILTPRPTPTS